MLISVSGVGFGKHGAIALVYVQHEVYPRILAVAFMSCGDTQISGWKKPRQIVNGNKLILEGIVR